MASHVHGTPVLSVMISCKHYSQAAPLSKASYTGLHLQLFSQPRFFPHDCEKSCEGRPGYKATLSVQAIKAGVKAWERGYDLDA